MREEMFHKWYREWRTIVKFAAKIHPSAHHDALIGRKNANVPGSSEGPEKRRCGLKDGDSEGGYARMDITPL
ncbi:unnamed protein product [Lasius platythorax]|uniref:Uncharacterized protein n=1 Tax=Lasius platythorax TaxID=488582 RepID=A0AAV2NAB8_9HYME